MVIQKSWQREIERQNASELYKPMEGHIGDDIIQFSIQTIEFEGDQVRKRCNSCVYSLIKRQKEPIVSDRVSPSGFRKSSAAWRGSL
jgi:hypothetical protein